MILRQHATSVSPNQDYITLTHQEGHYAQRTQRYEEYVLGYAVRWRCHSMLSTQRGPPREGSLSIFLHVSNGHGPSVCEFTIWNFTSVSLTPSRFNHDRHIRHFHPGNFLKEKQA